MKISLDIQDHKAEAFIKFIQTLDYVSITEITDLTNEQKQELDYRLETAKEQDFIALEEAIKRWNKNYDL